MLKYRGRDVVGEVGDQFDLRALIFDLWLPVAEKACEVDSGGVGLHDPEITIASKCLSQNRNQLTIKLDRNYVRTGFDKIFGDRPAARPDLYDRVRIHQI